MTDFEAYRHPVEAVACPDCQARAGAYCIRPSGHRAADYHAARKAEADRVFIDQHGVDAWIDRLPDGDWKVHDDGRAALRGEAGPKVELTPTGEQYVMPGCERQERRQGAQLTLWE